MGWKKHNSLSIFILSKTEKQKTSLIIGCPHLSLTVPLSLSSFNPVRQPSPSSSAKPTFDSTSFRSELCKSECAINTTMEASPPKSSDADHVIELIVRDTPPPPPPPLPPSSSGDDADDAAIDQIAPLLSHPERPKINIFTASYPRRKPRVIIFFSRWFSFIFFIISFHVICDNKLEINKTFIGMKVRLLILNLLTDGSWWSITKSCLGSQAQFLTYRELSFALLSYFSNIWKRGKVK